jgi:nucleotide-binding universal stress UspA family protein
MATGTGPWALERVLCATDFSDNAAAALDAAVAIARAVRAKVRVVHVAPLAAQTGGAIPGLPVPDGADTPGADLPAALERFASPAVAAGLETERVLCHGDPTEEIVREARRAAANLIVMGRRSHAGQSFVGSVAEGVAKSAPCPVMVVKPFPRRRGETPRRALCALDLGETAPATAAHAAALANALQADLVALHVVCGPGDGPPEPARHEAPPAAADALRDAREDLAALVADARMTAGRVRQEVVLGAPREAILGAAHESGADLVVVGSHGGGVLDRQFIGSTTLHLLRKADCDVLVVPAWVARRRPATKEMPALRSLGRA